MTPLHHAAVNGDVKIAKSLIDKRADIDARNRDGYTPLHYAAAYGCVEIAEYLVVNEANVNAQDKAEYTPLCHALANDKKELVKLLIKHGADRSLIKDEDLIDRLNSMCDQPSEVVPSTFSHSKTHNATETPEKAEKVEKRKAKLKELRTQLKDEKKKNELLKQQIQDLGNENATLKGELGKTKKNEVPLEKVQKELTELRNCVTGQGTRLEALDKLDEENQSLRQEIKNLKNENTTLKGTTKTKTDEVSLEKVEKRQFSPKVAYASLAAMLVVGAALSIAFGLSALLIFAASVVSALIAGGVTYTISKPIAPDTELKEVDIQGSAQHGVCKT